MDVDASRSIRQAEVGAMRKMIDRTEERFGITPDWIAADTAYGSSESLVWLTHWSHPANPEKRLSDVERPHSISPLPGHFAD